MRLKPLSHALSLLLASSHALAETPATLEEIVVTASRVTPPSPSQYDVAPQDLPGLRATTSDSASLLRNIPGVGLYGAGGVSSLPSIHGLADDRLRIRVDGMDLIAACPNHMNSPLSYIDPSAVAGVRVHTGVSPVSAGGDSLGGAILVESAPPLFAQPGQGPLLEGEAGGFYRGNGDAHGANLAATLASETLSLHYSGALAQAGNHTTGGNFKSSTVSGRLGHALPLDEVGSSAFEALNQSLGLAWRGDGHLLQFKYGRQHIPFENYPNQRMDMTDNVSDQFNLAYAGQLDWGRLKSRLYHEHTRHEMDFGADKRFWYGNGAPPTGSGGPAGGDGLGNGFPCSPISPACAAGMPMYTDGKNTGLNLVAELPLAGGGTLRLGGEYQAYRLDDWWPPSGAGMWPGTFWNIRDGERDRYAVFGEWETRLSSRWTSQLGLRHETVKMDAGDVQGYCTGGMCMGNQLTDSAAFNAREHERTDRNWDLAWLARHVPDATRTYEIGLARKTRSPNLHERYTWSTWSMAAVMNNFVGDGNGYVGHLQLQPEVAATLSLAADWHDADATLWGLKVAPYYTHVRDYIDAQCLPGSVCAPRQFNVLQYVNQSARLYGVDISGHRRLGGSFNASGSLSLTRGENLDTGEPLYNIMPLNARLALTHRRGPWRHSVEGVLVARKEHVSRVRNEVETPGHGLVHLRASYAGKRFGVDFGVENLFDRAYALPLGGAYVGQGTTMSINGVPWGIAVPGPGRSLYASLNVKF